MNWKKFCDSPGMVARLPINLRIRSKDTHEDSTISNLSDLDDDDIFAETNPKFAGPCFCPRHGCEIHENGIYRPIESEVVPCFCPQPFYPTLARAISYCARQLHITPSLVRQWVVKYYETGEIQFQHRQQRERGVVIRNERKVTPEMVIELNVFMNAQLAKGICVNAKTMQKHLQSDTRLHDLLSVDILPPCYVPLPSIKDAMTKCLGLKWGKVSKVGGARIFTEEERFKYTMRRRVWVAEYAKALQLEKEGKAIVVSMDESYCNERHVSSYSLLPTDGNKNTLGNVPAPKGKGRRICMIGAITRYGHVITHYPPGHPKEGQSVIDCDWLDAGNRHVDVNGSFVELNNEGKPRYIYGRINLPPGKNTAELRATADRLGVEYTQADVNKVLRDKIKCKIASMKADAINQGDTSRFVTANGKFDYHGYRASCQDLALTTDKFMIAKESKGDYHDNFDSIAFFKWCVAMELTYPVFCKELQTKLDNHRSGIKTYPFFMEDEADFWIEIPGQGRPARELIMVLDNAPYHKAVNCLLSSKTKDEIAGLLRDANVNQIRVTKGNGTEMNYEVPAVGEKWEHNNPSAEDLKSSALRVLRSVDPNFNRPPYQSILESKRDKWGPIGSNGWRALYSAPYVSPQVAVELKWAYGKNHVANPQNCQIGRSVAMVTSLLRERWYSEDCFPYKWFDMAHSYIVEYIHEDQAENADCPFTNDDLYNLQGFCDADIDQWKSACDMEMDGSNIANNDLAFEDEDDEEDDDDI